MASPSEFSAFRSNSMRAKGRHTTANRVLDVLRRAPSQIEKGAYGTVVVGSWAGSLPGRLRDVRPQSLRRMRPCLYGRSPDGLPHSAGIDLGGNAGGRADCDRGCPGGMDRAAIEIDPVGLSGTGQRNSPSCPLCWRTGRATEGVGACRRGSEMPIRRAILANLVSQAPSSQTPQIWSQLVYRKRLATRKCHPPSRYRRGRHEPCTRLRHPKDVASASFKPPRKSPHVDRHSHCPRCRSRP
jgi:hypothetical protein